VVGTSRVAGFAREHAASSFLGNAPRGALALCKELGVAVDRASPRAKRRWIFLDGRLRALPTNPIELARSDLLTWRGKLALLREPFAPAHAGGDDESMYAFASRRLGAEAARAIVAPFVTGVFAADARDVSLAAGFPKLAALDRAGGLVRGSAAQAVRALAKRARGGERLPRGMFAPAGGVGTLADALASSLGPRVHLGTRVHEIAPASGGVIVDRERWDACVLALPAADAAALVVDALPELAAKLEPFYRAPVALVYLGVPEAAVPRAGEGFGFLVAQGEDLRVLGAVFESTVWPDRAPAGQALLRCIFGGGRDPDAASLTDAELIALARRDVAHALGTRDLEPTHASVVRWDAGIAQYQLGHAERVRAAVTAARGHRIALAGADYRGTGLNDLCADADVVVAELRSW